jgi:hypothetical protein
MQVSTCIFNPTKSLPAARGLRRRPAGVNLTAAPQTVALSGRVLLSTWLDRENDEASAALRLRAGSLTAIFPGVNGDVLCRTIAGRSRYSVSGGRAAAASLVRLATPSLA